MNKDVFTAAFLSDEAKAFLTVEELNSPFASANDLRGHAVETATTAAAATRTTATARATAAKAVASATAEAITAAEAVSTAIIAVI